MRLIVTPGLHPWSNMALDRALDPDRPALRLYGWAPAGLTIGYFQRADQFSPAWLEQRELVLVRRETGGAAILHRDDLTFSIVTRPDHPLARGEVEASYARIHSAVARGLRLLGVEAGARLDAPVRSDSGRHGDPVCFHKATSFDLVAAGRKLVGSAQRRTRERFLQHGSIPIRANPLAPGSACLEQLLGRQPAFDEVALSIRTGFAEELGLEFVDCEPDRGEWQATEEWVTRRFGNESWNRRR